MHAKGIFVSNFHFYFLQPLEFAFVQLYQDIMEWLFASSGYPKSLQPSVAKIGAYWFRKWFVACSAPSQNLHLW